MTYRLKILNNIKDVLENIVGMQKVSINKPLPSDLDTIPFPAAFIFSGEALPVAGPYGYQTWDWTVEIELWTKDDAEELLATVYGAMAADVTRGSNASDCNMAANDFYIVDADNDVKGLLLKYVVQFRHPINTMVTT